MLNRCTILEPKSLWIEKWPTWHWVSLIRMEVKQTNLDKRSIKIPNYIRWYLIRGIKFKVYPRERTIHLFQAPLIIQKHGNDKNPRDELLLENPQKNSSPKHMHSRWSDYNKCKNMPFVYQLTLPEYHELI